MWIWDLFGADFFEHARLHLGALCLFYDCKTFQKKQKKEKKKKNSRVTIKPFLINQ
jgi:hypothetical protein